MVLIAINIIIKQKVVVGRLSGAAARTGDKKQKDNRRYMEKYRSQRFLKTKKHQGMIREKRISRYYVGIEMTNRKLLIMKIMEYNMLKINRYYLWNVVKQDVKFLKIQEAISIRTYNRLSGAAARTGEWEKEKRKRGI